MKKFVIFLLILLPIKAYPVAIDVGGNNGGGSHYGSNTVITQENSGNDTGTIDHLDLNGWMGGDMDVATFTNEGGTTFSTNGNITVTLAGGAETFNAPGDFTAFAITSGDYIGAYPVGMCWISYSSTGGSGMWWVSGDNIPASSVNFTATASWDLWIYGTGESGGGAGWSHDFGGVANANISSIGGVAIADIAKVGGVE